MGSRARRPAVAATLRAFLHVSAAATVGLAGCARAAQEPPRELRVCADPNNLPFSNDRQEGFENRLAELIARDMGASVRYTWWAQRRGFARNTLHAGLCDVIMGVPADYEPARTTRPYYRSTYAFVYAADRFRLSSLDDPALKRLRIGVHVIGDDYANAPPAHALARRGIVTNVVGYSLSGDYREPNPPARLVDAVAAGEVDVAIAWGPLAGYFAARRTPPLDVVPVTPEMDAGIPLAYAISLGVRRDDETLQEELDAILERRKEEIDALLREYGVPLAAGGR